MEICLLFFAIILMFMGTILRDIGDRAGNGQIFNDSKVYCNLFRIAKKILGTRFDEVLIECGTRSYFVVPNPQKCRMGAVKNTDNRYLVNEMPKIVLQCDSSLANEEHALPVVYALLHELEHALSYFDCKWYFALKERKVTRLLSYLAFIVFSFSFAYIAYKNIIIWGINTNLTTWQVFILSSFVVPGAFLAGFLGIMIVNSVADAFEEGIVLLKSHCRVGYFPELRDMKPELTFLSLACYFSYLSYVFLYTAGISIVFYVLFFIKSFIES